MSLIELLVASGVFALSATCSLLVWSSTASWSQRVEGQRQEQQQLEAAVIAVQAVLQRNAGTPLAPDCATALQVLMGQLTAMPGVEAAGDGGVLVRVQGSSGGSRQRWFDPAAYGLCGSEAVAVAAPLPSDGAIAGSDGGLESVP
jgi:type II secretory pathway component PulJ